MPVPWSRRGTLAALAALPTASLAGCTALQSYSGDEQKEYTLFLRSLDEPLADHLLWEPGSIDSSRDELEVEARRQAIEDGRFTTYGFPAISEDGEYTEYEGSYYRLSVVVTGERPMDRHVLRLRWLGDEDDEGVPEPATTVENLEGVDRHAAMSAYFAARSRHSGGGGPERMSERGGYVYRRNASENSVLVPEPEYETLSIHGTVLRVDVSEERVPEPAYSVVATRLGDSRDEYAAAVDAAQLDVRLSGADLSEAERRIVRKATWDDGYEETTPLDEAFEGVLGALDVDDVERAITRRYLRYDGEDYEYELYVNPA